MQDHELYRRILGIEAPWYVDSVELKLEVGPGEVVSVQMEDRPPEKALSPSWKQVFCNA
jgi:hypothetical protein